MNRSHEFAHVAAADGYFVPSSDASNSASAARPALTSSALAIARYLQDATGLSIKKIVYTLRPIQQVRVHIAGHEHLVEDPLTPSAAAILETLDLSPQ